VAAVATGRCHLAAATDDGELYSFGCGALGNQGGDAAPRRVAVDGGGRVLGVAAGEYFTLAAGADTRPLLSST